jgi:ribonuclease HII
LPKNFRSKLLRDSKEIPAPERYELRDMIEDKALSWGVASVDSREIDRINILNASFLAMHRAISKLQVVPEVSLSKYSLHLYHQGGCEISEYCCRFHPSQNLPR